MRNALAAGAAFVPSLARPLGAAGLPDFLERLPAGALSAGPGVWHVPVDQAFYNAARRAIEALGAPGPAAWGYRSGTMLLLETARGYHPLLLWERAALHPVEGALVRVAIMADLARGSIDCGPAAFALPPRARRALAALPLAGDGPARAPGLEQLRLTGRLTLQGDGNAAARRPGQALRDALDERGAPAAAPPERVLEQTGAGAVVGAYENGHNLPQAFVDFQQTQLGPQSLALLGLPISEAYWVEATAGGRPRWLLAQVFERAALTLDPLNPPEYQAQLGLAGSLLNRALLANEAARLRPAVAPPAPAGMARFDNMVGWAYTPDPAIAPGQMAEDLRDLRRRGANAVYVAHANPARRPNPLEFGSTEWGLCPAVWYAIVNNTARRAEAERALGAVRALLDAARAAKMRAVLAIGYQLQMGDEWSERHQEHIRRDSSGAPLIHWGKPGAWTASPYSPQYREDIRAYYEWVQREVVGRYEDVIVAVNIADEPMGADWSSWAREEFRRRSGTAFERAAPVEQGAFLAGMLADYARESAEAWRQVNRRAWTTSTFHWERTRPLFPDFERVFAEAPEGFVFSADTHWQDVHPDNGRSQEQFVLLPLLCRTIGWLSRVYNRRLMPWTGASGWSFGYQPGNGAALAGAAGAARENLEVVLAETRRMGGQIGFLMAFAFNITPLPEPARTEVFDLVVDGLKQARDGLSADEQGAGGPDCVIAFDADAAYRRVAAEGVDHLLQFYVRPGLAQALARRGLRLSADDVLLGRRSVVLKRGGAAFEEALRVAPDALVIDLTV